MRKIGYLSAFGALFIGTLALAASSDLLPFSADEFLPIASGIDQVVVEDLVVRPSKDGPLGRTQVIAEVGIKNRTAKKLQLSIYLALFDAQRNLVASGNYSTAGLMGGFEPKQSGTEKIQLGYALNLSEVTHYQYRITGFLEPPSK